MKNQLKVAETNQEELTNLLDKLGIKYELNSSYSYNVITLCDRWGEEVEYYFSFEDGKILNSEI
jgi:hypothetical protein